ncbi:F-box domain [Arabidopsis thaliana x Arabidopsis arenosa]|uniref:F-box domain n=1 Tax=Arabidopsis thaliana x Arabidopsis arenosa TaxID=1240361 RepID=A0A8T2C569_9BRAS|nr:F-box domain [Arabidopsis thaliana x Arabidopsis arenosa]
MEEVTRSVLAEEILKRLDLENLCSVACVSTTLRSAVVSGVLPSLTSLDLSIFSPDDETLNHVLRGCIGLSSLTLNCLRLNAASVRGVLGPHLRELHLLRCSLLSSTVLTSIGSLCPNLRVLTLEMADLDSPAVFQSNLTQMLNGCPYLESLQLNIRGILVDATAFQSVRFSLPETLKNLRLQPLLESEAILLMNRFKVTGTYLSQADYSALLSPSPSFTLQSLSLVLDLISDRLIIAITGSLPQLVKLDLEDRPEKEPFPDSDLTYTGLQALGCCQQLTSLSLVRTCYNRKISFKRINDMGIFLLSEACKGLESVRLGGFPKVSDAGFASLLHSCRNLKKFEIRGAFLLSDLAFHDVTGSSCSLQEVRLSTCPLITSEAVKKLGLCGNLEVLDLGSCKSISDSCLNSVSALRKLTSLNLAGADVTDSGMLALGKSDVPITQLSLRGCRRVSDRGISHLLNNEGTITKTLSTLDLGHMPGISDRAIHTITHCCKALTELSIRSCFHVTDSSIESLATRERQSEGGSKQLRKLNVHNCVSLTTGALRWLSKPSFAGLHWLGLGQTRFAGRKETVTATICGQRPWLTLCFDGCELGCCDGWEFHTPQRH